MIVGEHEKQCLTSSEQNDEISQREKHHCGGKEGYSRKTPETHRSLEGVSLPSPISSVFHHLRGLQILHCLSVVAIVCE
jgi:hypothetical protein